MTKIGKEEILLELDALQSSARKNALERIKNARKFCDFREDSEFNSALKSQAEIEERIILLQNMLDNAEVIIEDDQLLDTVVFGKSVTFIELPDGQKETYTIVGTEEADFQSNKISFDSPIAKSLLGKSSGDKVSVKTPGGEVKMKIITIE